jgi:hypothetical protein
MPSAEVKKYADLMQPIMEGYVAVNEIFQAALVPAAKKQFDSADAGFRDCVQRLHSLNARFSAVTVPAPFRGVHGELSRVYTAYSGAVVTCYEANKVHDDSKAAPAIELGEKALRDMKALMPRLAAVIQQQI